MSDQRPIRDTALRSRRSLDRDPDLLPHPVLASLMVLGRLRVSGSFVVSVDPL
jgi:hypothetical protein